MSNTVEVINGVRNWYGPRGSEDQLPSVVVTKGNTKEMEIDFTFASLPAASEDGAMVIAIPANSMIVSSRLFVKTAFDSGTIATDNLDIGLYESDGTVIDANGLDAGVTVDALTANTLVVGDGALVGASVGAAAGQVVIAMVAGTLTAGEAKLVIEYVEA